MPPVQNPTSASFAEGSSSCMAKALAKCKSERVTFAGALVGAVVAAFYHTATSQADFDPDQPFKLKVDMDYNMRQRVPHPAEEDHVAAFIAFADLDWLSEEGVDMKTTSFWDLARRAKREIDSNLRQKRMMAAVTMTVDQITNAKMDLSFANELHIKNSVDSDGNISNVGRYPFTREFSFGKEDRPLTVKSLHVYNPLPHLGPSAIFYVSSVESFCYSMGHKCEDTTASILFEMWVKICENIGEIGTSTTVAEMLRNMC